MTSAANDAIEYRVAETREDLEGAARLVYRNYLQKGFCKPNLHQMHFHRFDTLPETRVIVAVQNSRVIATLTLVFDSELGLPSDALYGAELARLRANGRRLAEITKLSIDRALREKQVAVLHQLSRLAYMLTAQARGMNEFCILVEPHHERFYRRICLFERLGEEKEDPSAGNASSMLLRLNLEEAPGKARAASGDSHQPSNLYWFYCLDPEAKRLECAARAADQRILSISSLPYPCVDDGALTSAQRGYLGFRNFVRGFVANCSQTADRLREASRRLQAVS